jgi:hypothetical protein
MVQWYIALSIGVGIVAVVLGVGLYMWSNQVICEERTNEYNKRLEEYNRRVDDYNIRANSLGGRLDLSGELAVERSHLEEEERELGAEFASLEETCF